MGHNTKLSKTQLSKIGQSGDFLGRLLEILLKTVLPLMKKVPKPLAKSILIPLGSRAAAAAAAAKTFWIGYDSINNFKWRNAWYYEIS